ncbi:spore germination lipoprotein GerD [Paenibacillus daejeonensis]|uniref:spore germination lipoprotein GerD n=1 Tax=Paenibacillus daejeonensis TaxID=135193 RepID=UPI000373F898|nr:spore germination lipoprotein GerD [Paenibacillus daejeonensis]
MRCNRWSVLLLTALMMLVLASCGSEPTSSSEPISYKDMKSMVIDILKTEDAQKALQESAMSTSGQSSGMGMGMLSVNDKEQVRMAVKEVLVSPDYDKVIKQLMVDPRFAGEFAKSVNSQNKEIHKELMKDPAYQEDLIKVMQNPEMDRMILDVLQSTQFRKHVATIMQESMQSPLVKLQLLDLMRTAVKEELEPKPDEKVEKEKKSGDGSGEGGEGGSGGDEQENSGNGEDSGSST